MGVGNVSGVGTAALLGRAGYSEPRVAQIIRDLSGAATKAVREVMDKHHEFMRAVDKEEAKQVAKKLQRLLQEVKRLETAHRYSMTPAMRQDLQEVKAKLAKALALLAQMGIQVSGM